MVADLTIRLTAAGESGLPFREYLRGRDPTLGAIAEVMILQWGHLRDDLKRPPTRPEYDEEWPARPGASSPEDEYRAFHALFPDELDPGRLWDLLWEGTRHAGFMDLMQVRVVQV